MNKLIVALMATAFAGSVMAADAVKATNKTEVAAPAGAAVTVATEKPAAAPKKANHKHVKKTKKSAAAKKSDATKSDMAAEPAMPAAK